MSGDNPVCILCDHRMRWHAERQRGGPLACDHRDCDCIHFCATFEDYKKSLGAKSP